MRGRSRAPRSSGLLKGCQRHSHGRGGDRTIGELLVPRVLMVGSLWNLRDSSLRALNVRWLGSLLCSRCSGRCSCPSFRHRCGFIPGLQLRFWAFLLGLILSQVLRGLIGSCLLMVLRRLCLLWACRLWACLLWACLLSLL